MIYPEQFEAKIGFDRIRDLVKSHCLFDPGKERVEQMEFQTGFEIISKELDLTEEFRNICQQEDEFPIQHFIDNREALKKAEVEGTYLLEEEVFGLVKSLDSVIPTSVYAIQKMFFNENGQIIPIRKISPTAKSLFPGSSPWMLTRDFHRSSMKNSFN